HKMARMARFGTMSTSGLVGRLDPAQIDRRADSAFARLPFAAVAAGLGNQPFVAAVIDKLMASSVGVQPVCLLLIYLAGNGLIDELCCPLLLDVRHPAGSSTCR